MVSGMSLFQILKNRGFAILGGLFLLEKIISLRVSIVFVNAQIIFQLRNALASAARTLPLEIAFEPAHSRIVRMMTVYRIFVIAVKVFGQKMRFTQLFTI